MSESAGRARPRRRRVALLTPDLRGADAVGMDTMTLARLFREAGFESSIFAPTGDRQLSFQRPSSVPKFLSRTDDLLVYQYAVAYETGRRLFSDARCVRVLRYHNVTPPEYFEPYSAQIAEACRIGRQGLSQFLGVPPDYVLPASEFNRRELEQIADLNRFGQDSVHVLPPLTDDSAMLTCEADLDWLGHLALGAKAGPTLLAVGRVVPNKGHRLLLRAFAHFRKEVNPEARLIVVGNWPPGLETYLRELQTLVAELDLAENVWFTGSISRSRLKSCFLSADLLVSASEHEGFCVPLVEAMALGLPIVALARAAVPETLGSAGLLVEESDPIRLAEACARLCANSKERANQIERGRLRHRSLFSARGQEIERIFGRGDEALTGEVSVHAD